MAQYQAAPATSQDPGKTLGIVGLIIALNQSKKAGFVNKFAKFGLIIGIILTVLYIVLYVVIFAVAMSHGTTTYGG